MLEKVYLGLITVIIEKGYFDVVSFVFRGFLQLLNYHQKIQHLRRRTEEKAIKSDFVVFVFFVKKNDLAPFWKLKNNRYVVKTYLITFEV